MNQIEPTDAIIISVPANHPEQLYDYFEQLPGSGRLTIKTIKTDFGPMAGIEYLMQTVVIAYLVKPFFDFFYRRQEKIFIPSVNPSLRNS